MIARYFFTSTTSELSAPFKKSALFAPSPNKLTILLRCRLDLENRKIHRMKQTTS